LAVVLARTIEDGCPLVHQRASRDKHIALEFTANAHATTLTEANGFLRGPLTLPEHESPPQPQPQPRFRLGEASQ